MATSSTSSRRFSRAMALAIATGITLTGSVQIVNDTHVAQAETKWVNDPSEPKESAKGVGYPVDNYQNIIITQPYDASRGYGTIVAFYDDKKSNLITPNTLEKAGLDLTQPITTEISTREPDYKIITATGEKEEIKKQTYEPGAIRGVVFESETGRPETGSILLRQGKTLINIQGRPNRVLFRGTNIFELTAGEEFKIQPPTVSQWYYQDHDIKNDRKGVTTLNTELRKGTPGASLSDDGELTYTPPESAIGSTVRIEIAATPEINNIKGYTETPEFPNKTYGEAVAVYEFKIVAPPAQLGLKDNGDGTFTFNSGEEGAKDVTINTKDGVQDVAKQGNTLVFTMADGTKKKVDVAANITLKENNDGTATISDGKTTITVATANTYVKEIVNTKGKYTLKLSNGDTVSGAIDTSKNVKGIENGPDGSIVLVYNDNTKSKPIALTQTTVTQTGKGTNNHTVTITSPNGEKVIIKAANTYIDKVEKNAKGDYVLTRNDSKTFTVNLQDIRNDISTLKKKNSPSRAEHKAVEDKVDNLRKELNEFTNSNNDSLKELADQINALDDKVDANAKEFKRDLTGISTDLQDLEFRVERTENRLIKEVRDNHDGTFTLVTEKYGDIKGDIDVSSGVTNIISNSDGTITLEFAGKEPRTIDLHQVEVTETGKGTPKHTITIKVPGEEPFRFNAFDTYVTNIETDGKGTYTLKLNNGETVTGAIDTSKTIKSIENRSDGSIVLVRTDGTKSKPIKLEQVKITEANKGTPEHTVTIKVPGGETVTLDAYDNFVTSVTKKSDGVYEITRNDGKSWKINITDLYKRVADLEAKDSPTRDEFNAVKKDIADYKKLVDKRFTKVEGDIDALRADLTAVEKRVTVLEARVDRIDNVLGDLAKCNSAKQIAAIPTALSVALYALSQMQLPGVADINTQIQQQIGVYNANAAKMWGQYGGVLQTAAATTMAAGLIGSLAYALSECQPYNRTDEMKNTPAGEMTAKTDIRKAEREARAQARAEAREAKQTA